MLLLIPRSSRREILVLLWARRQQLTSCRFTTLGVEPTFIAGEISTFKAIKS